MSALEYAPSYVAFHCSAEVDFTRCGLKFCWICHTNDSGYVYDVLTRVVQRSKLNVNGNLAKGYTLHQVKFRGLLLQSVASPSMKQMH